MTDASITLGIDGRPAEQGAKVVKGSLESVKKEAGSTVTAVKNTSGAFDRLKQSAFGLRGAFQGLVAAMSVREIIRYSDTWKQLQGRLENATGSAIRAANAQRDLYQTSQQNRTAFAANAQLYGRLAVQSEKLGLSHQRLMTIVTAVGQSFKISGSATTETAGAIRQLSQALGSGVLRGDEFNSVMENAPRLQKAIADSLKVSTGDLRAMAEAGELSALKVVNAIEKQADVIAREMTRIPLTVQDAFVKLDNAFLKFIGQSGAIAAGTGSIALAISKLADNFETLADIVTVTAVVYVARLVPAFVTSTAAAASAAISSGAAATAALAHAEAEVARTAAIAASNLGMSASANLAAAQAAATLGAAQATAASAGAFGLLTKAAAGFMAILPVAVIVGFTAAIVQMTKETDVARQAHERLNQTLNRATGLQSEYINASAERRKQIREDIKANIASYQAELKALSLLIAQYQKKSSLALGFEEFTGRARQLVNKVAPGLLQNRALPSDVANQAQNAVAAVKELQEILDNLGKGGNGSGGSGGIKEKTSAMEKFNEKLREALELAKADADAFKISERQRFVAKALVEAETAAREDYNKKLRTSAELLESERIQITQRASATFDLVDQLKKEEEARDKIKDLIEDTRTPAEKLSKELQDLESLRPFAKTPQELDAINRKVDQLREGVNPMAEVFRRTAEGITDAFTSAFRNILDGRGGFKGVMDAMLGLLKDTIARMAVIALARPVIVPIISSVGSALGVGDSAIQAVTGQLGGTGGLSTGASLISGFSGLGGNLSGTFAGGILDSIGGALGLSNAGFVGPMLPGQTAGISGAFTGGAALAGIAGGLLANALGLGGGIGGTVGGALGGVAGTAIGANMGTILGFAGGPAGALIGAFAGTALGGLFKKKPSSKLQSGALDLATGDFLGRGGLTGNKFDQGNFDTVTSLGQLATGLAGIFGARGDLQLAAGNRRGLEYAFTGEKGVFDYDNELRRSFDNANEFVKALAQDFADRAGKDLSDSLRTAMENIDFGKSEEDLKRGLEDLVFAAGFDDLGKDESPIVQAKQKIDEINAAFDKAAATAKRLGLEEAKVEAARRKTLDALRSAANQSAFNSLYEVTDPAGLARYNEQLRFSAQLQEVQAVNGNLEAVYALHRLNMLRIDEQYNREEVQSRVAKLQDEAQKADSLAQSYSRVAEVLQGAISSLRIGQLSTLSPLAKYQEAGSQFSATLEKALAGNIEAAEQLPSLGQQFLELSQAYNSSNEIFAQDFERVQKGLEEARKVAISQTDIQISIAAAAWKQVETAEKGFSALEAAIKALGAFGKVGGGDAFTGSSSNAAGRSLSEVTSSGLSVGQIESTARALLGGYTGPTGSGELSKMLADRGLNDAFVASLRAQGAKGFADGGLPYSEPFIVGERGPEVIADRRSAMVIPFQQNAAILRELQSVRKAMEHQTRALQDGLQQQIEETKSVKENTSRLADDTAIAKRRRA